MSVVTKGISMLILSLLVLGLLVMVVLGFMLGFTHPLPWILIGVLIIIPIIHDKIIATRFVEWKDAYSVGIEIIDSDHKKLLSLINQLQAAAHYKTDDESIENILNQLVDYTQYHFSREEKMMQEQNYPDYEEHKLQHDNMILKVTKYIDEYRIDKTRTIEDVAVFLKTWLVNHINGTDQKYVPYLK